MEAVGLVVQDVHCGGYVLAAHPGIVAGAHAPHTVVVEGDAEFSAECFHQGVVEGDGVAAVTCGLPMFGEGGLDPFPEGRRHLFGNALVQGFAGDVLCGVGFQRSPDFVHESPCHLVASVLWLHSHPTCCG